jgi:hypothetical protein
MSVDGMLMLAGVLLGGWADRRLALRMATGLAGLPVVANGAGERGVLTEVQLETTLDVDGLQVVDPDARRPLIDLG